MLSPAQLQPCSMEAVTTCPRHLRPPLKGKRRRGSLEAAVVQCLALGVMCIAAAYPSWVVVRVNSFHFVLGIVWVLNHRDPSSNCPFVSLAGLILLNLTALCCLLAILSSCGAMLLDFLGLKLGKVTATFLHGFVALFAAIAAASNCGLWALTRHNLHSAQDLQPVGHSSVVGLSFYLCILACALAAIATGWSYAASAQVEPSAAVCLASSSPQQPNPVPVREQDSTSNVRCFETGLPLAACIAFLQRETERQAEEGLPFKQEGAEPQAEKGAHFTHKGTDLQTEEALSPKQVNTCPRVTESPYPTKEN